MRARASLSTSIDIEVDEGAGFALDARTERGDIRIGDDAGESADGDRDRDDLDEDDQRDADREERFRRFRSREEELVREINGGGDELSMRTVNGSIQLRRGRG